MGAIDKWLQSIEFNFGTFAVDLVTVIDGVGQTQSQLLYKTVVDNLLLMIRFGLMIEHRD